MKKDNRGFTLVELLAVIVILGLLVILSIPYISKYINYDKNKTYVQDSIKLISLAEYKLNSNSMKIEKPDPDNCIVLSFNYINDSSIGNPPNKGEYSNDTSFVVVKNNSGKLEYYVELIENVKGGGYAGVKLSSEKQLDGNKGVSRAGTYKEEELININDITADQINEYLESNAVNEIEKVYFEDELEKGAPGNAASPKIINAYTEYIYNDGNASSLNVPIRLNVIAIDEDSVGEDELKVCIKESSNSKDSYLGPNDSGCVSYTSGSKYSIQKYFTFNMDDCSSGNVTYYYISVYDPNNNSSKKKIEFSTKNRAPKVKSSITKRDGDGIPTHVAKITLDELSDDRDKNENLSFCISQRDTCDDEFRSYNDTFKKGYVNYTVKKDGIALTRPEAGTYDIYVIVRDKCNLDGVSNKMTYTVSDVTKPKVDLTLVPDRFNDTSFNDLSGVFNLSVSDNFTSNDELMLNIKYGSVTKEISYSEYLNDPENRKYNFGGKYDGKDRELTVKVFNKYGEESSVTKKHTNVYTNRAPVISNFSISSNGNIGGCHNGDDRCYGTAKVDINLNVTDDVDSYSNLQYCLYETNKSDCEFERLGSFTNAYTFRTSGTSELPYVADNSLKKLHIVIKDQYGEETESASNDYQLYVNQAPTISGSLNIDSADASIQSNTVNIGLDGLNIDDDFDNYTVKYCYTVDSKTKCTDYKSFSDLQDELLGFTFLDNSNKPLSYEGQTIYSSVYVKDNYGEEAHKDFGTYDLYNNTPPEIVSAYIKSKEEEYNSKDVYVYIKVRDPGDTYTVKICSGSKCTNYSDVRSGDLSNDDPITEETIETDTSIVALSYSNNEWEYDGGTKSIVITVTDSVGNQVQSTDFSALGDLNYEIYKSCNHYSPSEQTAEFWRDLTLTGISYTYVGESGQEINHNNCGGKCYRQKITTIENGIPKITFVEDQFKARYNQIKSYTDLVGSTCPNLTEEHYEYCDMYLCVGDIGDETDNAIGITRIPDEVPWYREYNGKTYTCTGHYNKYHGKVEVEAGESGVTYTLFADDSYKICDTLMDKTNAYAYNSSSSMPYIRIDDGGIPIGGGA